MASPHPEPPPACFYCDLERRTRLAAPQSERGRSASARGRAEAFLSLAALVAPFPPSETLGRSLKGWERRGEFWSSGQGPLSLFLTHQTKTTVTNKAASFPLCSRGREEPPHPSESAALVEDCKNTHCGGWGSGDSQDQARSEPRRLGDRQQEVVKKK